MKRLIYVLLGGLSLLPLNVSGQVTNSTNNGGNTAGGDINIYNNYPTKKNINDSLESIIKDRFTKHNDLFKILIFPFKQDTKYLDCEKQYGDDIYNHLIDLNSKESLQISVGWLTNDYRLHALFTTDSFEAKGRCLGADLIIFGNYDKICTAKPDDGEVCVKYISLYGKERQTDGKKISISNIQSSEGEIIAPVKGLLYKIMAMKNVADEKKFYHYSGLAISNGAVDPSMFVQILYKQVEQFPRIYNYEEFHRISSRMIKASERLTAEEGLAEIYLNLSKAYIVYGEYDTALSLASKYTELWPESMDGYEISYYCAKKLKNDSLQRDISKRYRSILRDVDNRYNDAYAYGFRNYYTYTSFLFYNQKNWSSALAYLDSAANAVKMLSYISPFKEQFPNYYINMYRAFIQTRLSNFSEAANHLLLADSIDQATCNNLIIYGGSVSVGVTTVSADGIEISELPVQFSNTAPSTETGIYNSWARNYLPDTPYCRFAYIYNGNIFKIKSLLHLSLGIIDSAYYWYNFYIDSTASYINMYSSKKSENWPQRGANSIIKLSFEDYYNRSLLAAKLGYLDRAKADVNRSISMNNEYQPSKDLQQILQNYSKPKAIVKRVRDFVCSFENFNW